VVVTKPLTVNVAALTSTATLRANGSLGPNLPERELHDNDAVEVPTASYHGGGQIRYHLSRNCVSLV
jgi:hypothetical protein